MSDMVLFGPYNMNGQKCKVQETTERSHPGQDVQSQQIARRDGSIQVAHNYAEKVIELKGRIKKPSGHDPTFRSIEDEFDNAMSKNQRKLRIARNWIKILDADDDTEWAVADDATNLGTDTYNYQISDRSVSFDVDVSASGNNYATVTATGFTAVDLSSVSESGNIEFWIYLPDAELIDDIDVRWGNDSSNYWYEDGNAENYEGKYLETGWNYMSIYWPTAEEEGVPSGSAIDYLFIRINYQEAQEDEDGFLINGFRWVDEDSVVNYEITSLDVSKPERHYNIDFQPFTAQVVCNDPFGYGTVSIQVIERSTQVSASKTIDLDMEGSYNPDPVIVYTINTPADLDTITYRNVSSDQEITVQTSWTAQDVIEIDTGKLTCKLNGLSRDYSGVFPDHIVGVNKVRTIMESTGIDTQEQTTQNAQYSEDDVSTFYYAQSFSPGSSGVVTSVGSYFKIILGDVYNSSFFIYQDNGGEPGTVLGSCGGFAITQTSFQWEEFAPLNNISLVSGSTYWLVLILGKRNSLGGYANAAVGYDTNGGYASGSVMKREGQGGSWTSISGDLTFRVVTEPETSYNYDWDVYYKKKYL